MALRSDVLEAMQGADRVGEVVTRLKNLYGLTDKAIGDAIGLASQQSFQARRTGKHRFTFAEVMGLSKLFGLPPEIFALPPTEAVRRAVELDPELDAPWRGVTPNNACLTAAECFTAADERALDRAAARRRHPAVMAGAAAARRPIARAA